MGVPESKINSFRSSEIPTAVYGDMSFPQGMPLMDEIKTGKSFSLPVKMKYNGLYRNGQTISFEIPCQFKNDLIEGEGLLGGGQTFKIQARMDQTPEKIMINGNYISLKPNDKGTFVVEYQQ